jgi:CHAT domain-containing protein
MKPFLKCFNLQIEKTPAKNSLLAIVRDEKNAVLATNDFRLEMGASILTRMEDNVGANLKENVRAIKEFGSSLFKSVFNGEVLDCFASLRHENIRLRLYFKKRELDLLRIPWEFMFDGRHFLSANPKVSMTRVLKGISRNTKKVVGNKLKMLAVISSPLDLPESHRLHAGKERMIIHQAIAGAYVSDSIEIDFVEKATLRNIQEMLDIGEYHIFHFTGHGIYSRKERTCFLLFEDEFGSAIRVDNERIADFLSRHESLCLVVLSGCQTALAMGHRVLGDLPAPLLMKEIPAVVAMQYTVTNYSAMDLARTFYSGIANGFPLDVALTKARRALLRNKREGLVDFGTPILYGEPDCLWTKYKEHF